MEDYAQAFAARYLDVETLTACDPCRTVAAMHLGGIAVECNIKAMILAYHRIGSFTDRCNRPAEPEYGQVLDRPGHHLLQALKKMTRLYNRAKADRLFLQHLNRVMYPAGAVETDFISLRYVGIELGDESVQNWKRSFRYIKGRLKKNGVTAV